MTADLLSRDIATDRYKTVSLTNNGTLLALSRLMYFV